MKTLPSDYKTKYDPTSWASGEKTLSLDVPNPGSSFRVFIPGGATRVSLITYAERDARLGVITRFGMTPQCIYTAKKNEAEYNALPWNNNNGTGISGINGQDYQCENWGGYSRILDAAVSGSPGWVYVKSVAYNGGSIRNMKFNVTVDVDAYKAWYEGAEWSGNVPIGASGIAGGNCDPLWSQAGTGGGTDPVDDPEEQNVSEFECVFIKGGTWVDGKCVDQLPEPEPEPDPVEPAYPKTIVLELGGGVDMKFDFGADNIVTITSGDVTLLWKYEETEDGITIRQ